jgi:hypothetical protein
MKRRAELLCVAVFMSCMVWGCATTAGKYEGAHRAEGKDQTVEVLKPSGIHEDCMELAQGRVLSYSFEASAPLSFNIHYHDNGDVVHAVKKDGVTSDRGAMTAPKKHHYCLMWTNTAGDMVKITYSYRVEDKR